VINYNVNFVVLVSVLHRTIPQVEIEAVSEFLFHLLTGDVEKLPTEALVHMFWDTFYKENKAANIYLKCLSKHGLTAEVKCYRDIENYCGLRFGQETPERLEQCRRLLANKTNATAVDVDTNIARIFAKYSSCFTSYRRRVDADCTHILRQTITSRHLRATKVVRATMNSMRPLLLILPTLKIIHLVRDPRAVAVSRSEHVSSVRGIYADSINNSESSVIAEASLYCRHVIADIRSRSALEREFPGRILSIRYEDVVANPDQMFLEISKFLDEPMPRATHNEMQKLALQGQTMKLSTKWQKITYKEAMTIARHCAEYFTLLNVSSAET